VRRQRPEIGFTLAELLVVTVILGIILFPLTESVILGLKTTTATANRVSGSLAAETIGSFFFGDVHSATSVATTATGCATADAGVFLHLGWKDQGTATDVSYALDPQGGGQDLVRLKCADGGTAESRVLGHFNFDPAVVVTCSPTCTAPTSVILSIRTDPNAVAPTVLTAQRRTT
jgi:prepilin-type N-terminal cleavage/methylation domain-containing protein